MTRPPRAPRRAVYVSYDGLGDPLGRSQVLPYVEGLAARGHQLELVTFEKPGTALRWREPLAPRVRWTALRYHRTPTVPATAFDMASGGLLVALAGLARRADLVHVRSYVPATLALPWVRLSGTPLLFDMRGLWPDEKVDGGAWSREGHLYRGAKHMEGVLLRHARAITVLTHSMQRHLRDEHAVRAEIRAGITVIPTCADLDTFRTDVTPDEEVRHACGEAATLVYVGSLGTWYMSDEMARFYLAWRRAVAPRRAKLLVVTRDDPSPLRAVLEAAGAGDEMVVRAARREQVAPMIRCAEAAVCFIRPSFSKRGSAPTKLGEILGCGLPVAANVVGDMGEVLAGETAGVVVESMSDASLDRAARQLAAKSNVSPAARRLAERWFSLDAAVDAYDAIYRSPLGTEGSPRLDRRWPPVQERG